MCEHMDMYILVHIRHTYTHICIYTYIYMHAYIHTYKCIYIQRRKKDTFQTSYTKCIWS